MRRILFSLFALFVTATISAQITVYEFKNSESTAYATFELDSPLIPDSTSVRGLYRAFEHLNVHYFDMAFYALAHTATDGSVTIRVKPYFYNHANLIMLTGEREQMDEKDCFFTFKLQDDTITDITPEAIKKKILYKSTYTQKKYLDFTKFPETFTKTKTVDWKKIPSKLVRNLQGKDKTFYRHY